MDKHRNIKLKKAMLSQYREINAPEFFDYTSLVGKKKLYIWKVCAESDDALEIAKKSQCRFAGFIDDVISEYDGKAVCSLDGIPAGEESFIYIPLHSSYFSVIDNLEKRGYLKGRDYYYPANETKIIRETFNQNYCDDRGNVVCGEINAFSLKLVGDNNRVFIAQGTKIDPSVTITCTNGAVVVFDENCFIGANCNINVISGASIRFGRGTRFASGANIMLDNYSFADFGADSTFADSFTFRAVGYSVTSIGKDCMFSSEIKIQPSDGHAWYFLDEDRSASATKVYEINIGDHVWVGRNSSIRYGACIGSGSIVGMNSFVMKECGTNSVLAGNPAVVIRENVAWKRESFTEHESYGMYSDFDFRGREE